MDGHISNEVQRKELLDYLRNLQRLHEERAKSNGTTTWILLAAMAYFGNWFANRLNDPAVSTYVVTGLSVALLFFFWMLVSSPPSIRLGSNDTRLINLGDANTLFRLPFNLVKITLAFLPLVASYVLFGFTLPVMFVTGVALFIVVYYVVLPLVKIFREKPLVRMLDRGPGAVEALGPTLAFICMGLHAFSLSDALSVLDSEGIVFVGHVAAFWLVATKFFQVVAFSEASSRYTKLEEALVFGLASAEEILQKLEIESLGPSLEKELESREKKIEATQQRYDQAVSDFKHTVEEISQIPQEYESERESRFDKGFVPVQQVFDELIASLSEKMDFIISILRMGRMNVNPRALQILEKDKNRLKDQVGMLQTSTKQMFLDTKRILEIENK